MKTTHKKNGFSLIELLVVATIIIVLAGIGMVSFVNAGKGARDSRRKADLENVRQALVLYKTESATGQYPYPSAISAIARYSALKATLTPTYINTPEMPVDPKNVYPNQYSYWSGTAVGTNTSTFCMCALVEDTSNGNEASYQCNGAAGPKIYYCVRNP